MSIDMGSGIVQCMYSRDAGLHFDKISQCYEMSIMMGKTSERKHNFPLLLG